LLAGRKAELTALSRRDIVFAVALHAPEAEIHDRITRAPGSFAETVEGINNLVN
jgi:MoaA/NifB/PqqE/SkfB family radical SAM enzyme